MERIYLGKNIKYLRNIKGITQKELGLFLGFKDATIAGYELGTREPDLLTLAKIGIYFDIDLDSLINKDLKLIDYKGCSLKDEMLRDVDSLSVDQLEKLKKLIEVIK